jgi:hypothetical protein
LSAGYKIEAAASDWDRSTNRTCAILRRADRSLHQVTQLRRRQRTVREFLGLMKKSA